jgi:hypothetical protein
MARRNPAPEDAEFTADQVAYALGESRARGYELMGTAGHLDSHLPGTKAALYDGSVSLGKARLIATATGLLDEAEARAAEQEVLDRAARLTPGGLRAAIARAVIKAAPKKARSAGRPWRSSPGWSGGLRTRATPPWPAANSRPTRPWPRTSGLPPGPGS